MISAPVFAWRREGNDDWTVAASGARRPEGFAKIRLNLMATRAVYQFREFTLEAGERRLSRGGVAVHLPPKAYELLLMLVAQPGRLLTKDELLARIWPDAFVEEGILAVHVSAVRKALGDDARPPTYIETVSGSGYRFIAPVSSAPSDDRSDAARGTLRPLEVYELVGRGRAHLLSASYFELPQAVGAFLAALEMDPTYAAAHAGLALARCGQATQRAMPHLKAYAEAKASALRALAMDGECADAQVALGEVLFLSEWDWTGAERSFRRALEINPNHTEAYLHYGGLMEALGCLDRGLQLKQQALERDPFSAMVAALIAVSFWNQRRYDDAISWVNKALERDPRNLFARELLVSAYFKTGQLIRMLDEDLSRAALLGVSDETLAAFTRSCADIKRAYEAGGNVAAVRCILEHTQSGERNAGLPLVVLYAEAGDLDTAFAHLDRAIDDRDPALVHLAVAPEWDSLRVDPRFNQRLARMKLAPARGHSNCLHQSW